MHTLTEEKKKQVKKKRKKTKHSGLQQLWDEGKVKSLEFYDEVSTFIKWRLMPDLIRRGVYKNGVRQINFSKDDVDKCYAHVLRKVLNEYNPDKGSLPTYIRWQIRGFGQLIIQKQARRHKYIKSVVSLDDTMFNTVLEDYKNQSIHEGMDDKLDKFYFGSTVDYNLFSEEIEEIREKVEKYFKEEVGLGEWLRLK